MGYKALHGSVPEAELWGVTALTKVIQWFGVKARGPPAKLQAIEHSLI